MGRKSHQCNFVFTCGFSAGGARRYSLAMTTRAPLGDEALTMLRGGDPEGLCLLLESLSPADRALLRRSLLATARVIAGAPSAARNQECWDGALSDAHHQAADVALYGTITAAQVARGGYMDPAVAGLLLPRLFPDDLELFAEAWAGHYVTRPKAWDNIRKMPAMFEWALQDLIPPPTSQGAVLLLVTRATASTVALLDLVSQRDHLLARETLPWLFRVPGVKGASAAQYDATDGSLGRNLGNFLVPELIRSGVWDRAEVLSWCGHAVAMQERSAYDRRWFHQLQETLGAGC